LPFKNFESPLSHTDSIVFSDLTSRFSPSFAALGFGVIPREGPNTVCSTKVATYASMQKDQRMAKG
jgi:hypothetical protein